MSLNLNSPGGTPGASSAYCTSPAFTDAVNDAQFVRTFGIIALIASVLIVLGGAVALGVSLAVLGFGSTRYYRVLGVTLLVLSLVGFFIGPFRIIASAVLCAGLLVRGAQILSTLAAEGAGDPDYQATRKRAILGMALSAVGLLFNAGWMTLFILTALVDEMDV